MLHVHDGGEEEQWVRRGAGSFKINKDRESGVHRFLMRDETNLAAILINAVLDHRIVLTPISEVDPKKTAGWVCVCG